MLDVGQLNVRIYTKYCSIIYEKQYDLDTMKLVHYYFMKIDFVKPL